MQKFSFLILTLIVAFTVTALAKEQDDSVVKNLVVDKERMTISYELRRPATVRIRAGSKAGPLHRTLVNWQKQRKGKHAITWDGMDSSATFAIVGNKNFTFSFNYYLPGRDEPVFNVGPAEDDVIVADYFIGRAPKFTHLSALHKNHVQERCKDIEVLFELPADIQKTKQGIARIGGTCPITIQLPGKDTQWFSRERFSINIFIDDIFVHGEALGYAPYAWNFNPQGINPGKHLITVNIKGFNDHIAVGSLPVYIATADNTDKL